MDKVKPIRRLYSRYTERLNLRELKDFRDIQLTPQKIVDGKALIPGVSFVFANTEDRLFIIHIALAEDGKYYFGYTLYLDYGVKSCYPSVKWRDHKVSDTLVKCIIAALEYCGNISSYYNTPPDKRLTSASKDALREMNSYRLRQLSIFDIL